MNPDQIRTAIAGDDPILHALIRVESLQQDLGVAGFLLKIIKDDEWSLVLKVNALMEATLIHVLTHGLGIDALEKQFRDMNHARRIEFAAAAGLLKPLQKRFMITLNALRNAFAHDVQNIDISINSYAATLNDARRESLRVGLNALNENSAHYRTLSEEHPKTMLIVSAITTLAVMHDLKLESVNKRDADRRSAEIFNALALGAAQIMKEADVRLPPLPNSVESDSPPSSQTPQTDEPST